MKLIGRPVIQAGVVVLLQLPIDLCHSTVVALATSLQLLCSLLFERNCFIEDREAAIAISFSPLHGRGKPDLAHIAVVEESAAQIDVIEENFARFGEACQCKHGTGFTCNLRTKPCLKKLRLIEKTSAQKGDRSLKFCH